MRWPAAGTTNCGAPVTSWLDTVRRPRPRRRRHRHGRTLLPRRPRNRRHRPARRRPATGPRRRRTQPPHPARRPPELRPRHRRQPPGPGRRRRRLHQPGPRRPPPQHQQHRRRRQLCPAGPPHPRASCETSSPPVPRRPRRRTVPPASNLLRACGGAGRGNRTSLPKWRNGDVAACHECVGYRFFFTSPDCGHTATVTPEAPAVHVSRKVPSGGDLTRLIVSSRCRVGCARCLRPGIWSGPGLRRGWLLAPGR